MTEYVCKYTPIEILAGFEEKAELYNLSTNSFERADKIMHRNICSFSRALIEHRIEKNNTPLVMTECCDSLRRTGNVLTAQGQKVFTLDLPHKDVTCARKLYQKEIINFIEEFSAYTGKTFNSEKFIEACNVRPEKVAGPYAVLMGARMSEELYRYIKSNSPMPIVNLMCTGNRQIGTPPPAEDINQLMEWYTGELLSQPPCMRMTDVSARKKLINDPNIRGIIYNTVSFCDYYIFEYIRIAKELSLPILKIETDYTTQSAAQIKNRLDAFFENLNAPETKEDRPLSIKTENSGTLHYFAGIDSGSTSTNAVIIDNKRNIVSFSVLPTGASVMDSAKKVLGEAFKKSGIHKNQINRIVSTGYGRTGIEFCNRNVTEITCHAKGAYFLDPRLRTVIDIGGQDSKIIRLNENGTVKDFTMNDKCAAGTGRFLEMMAHSLGITLEEMSRYGLEWDEEIVITSMCSVFAQSEVVSLIASGKKLADIVHGLNASVASKVISLGGRTGMNGEFMMTGGVAKNAGVVQAIENKLGATLLLPDEPEICGALGAALIAQEEC